MNRVFVTQDPRRWDKKKKKAVRQFDLTPATSYGELVVLVPYAVRAQHAKVVMELLHEKLHDFDDGDFILPTGNPVIIGLASAVAADYNEGRVAFLRWSKTENAHFPIVYKNVFRED